MERSSKTTVTALRVRRVRAAAPPIGLAGRRAGGRMWINGRELGDPVRFRHLASPPG